MRKEQQLQFISVERIPQRRQAQPCGTVQTRRRRTKERKWGWLGIGLLGGLLMLAVLWGAGRLAPGLEEEGKAERRQEIKRQEELLEASGDPYPQELLRMLELNEETLTFVESYRERLQWLGESIDLSGEIKSGQVPLLLQWDRRWGYDAYGDGMIGWAGCGPVCMTMAYLYLTDDTAMNPRKMAEFADQNGYHSENGTNWDFWTTGAAELGLQGEELPLSESAMMEALDEGGVLVCSMGPGDFTTTGHYILIRGYDEGGFYVNDPNRRSNSEKQWDYDTLQRQIKNLWVLSKK